MEVVWSYLVVLIISTISFAALAEQPCSTTDIELIGQAFSSVTGFGFLDVNCTEIDFPAKNLTGSVSWGILRNLSYLHKLDLSGNSLQGSIPGSLWSASSLVDVNLAGNRFGGALRFNPGNYHSLRALNLSNNRFTRAEGMKILRGLKKLDLSNNSMNGSFPDDFPPLEGLDFLNISYNNFTGQVDSNLLKKFGSSTFIRAGSLTFSSIASPSKSHSHTSFYHETHDIYKKQQKPNKKSKAIKAGVFTAISVMFLFSLFIGVCFVVKRKQKWRIKKEEKIETGAMVAEASWVNQAKRSSPVVVFEKPLMKLTFKDLAIATSWFGRESQLADGGRSGPLYRCVLPGEFHAVVRVLNAAEGIDEHEAAAVFRDLSKLQHPNLLPLLGYCITGKEKLVLYEYMERGDLHRWLYELPAGQPDIDDWSTETWDQHHCLQEQCFNRSSSSSNNTNDKPSQPVAAAAGADWPTRHRIALGIARGLAFLHQGWIGSTKPLVHGHLVASNVLLGEDFEPRISDFPVTCNNNSSSSNTTVEADVYDYGLVVMELVTGSVKGKVSWVRGLIRDGRGVEAVDKRLMITATEWEKEIGETLGVAYLCTAQSPAKRPTMQQVVGLLKDIRPTSSVSFSSSSS